MYTPTQCRLCPRDCQTDRTKTPGYCRGGDTVKIASASPHFGEERCISGNRGSGTIFFTGCSLRCVFCQNHTLRDGIGGHPISVESLSDTYFSLQAQGVHNINLVTPTHYRPWLQAAVAMARENGLTIPIVWNTSGYETLEAIRSLWDTVDVWMYDLKFYSSSLSQKVAGAPDYFPLAFLALQAALQQTGPPVFDKEGVLQRGVVVRQLVLPGFADDAVELIEAMANAFDPDDIVLSLMRQYRPPLGVALPSTLRRRLLPEEYEIVAEKARSLGFADDYFQ